MVAPAAHRSASTHSTATLPTCTNQDFTPAEGAEKVEEKKVEEKKVEDGGDVKADRTATPITSKTSSYLTESLRRHEAQRHQQERNNNQHHDENAGSRKSSSPSSRRLGSQFKRGSTRSSRKGHPSLPISPHSSSSTSTSTTSPSPSSPPRNYCWQNPRSTSETTTLHTNSPTLSNVVNEESQMPFSMLSLPNPLLHSSEPRKNTILDAQHASLRNTKDVHQASCVVKVTPPVIQEFVLKLVLIGDSGVGKSNLVTRFIKNLYNESKPPTIGFEFATKTLRVGDKLIKAQIWDTAGQERFRSLTAAYYRNAVGALVVYDITHRASFEHLESWLAQIKEHAHKDLVLILVGNKSDLAHCPLARQVSTLEAARFAEAHKMEFIETSAMDASNVIPAFKKIILPLAKLLAPTPATQSIVPLPPGWRRVASRTRPGEYSYENKYTKERIAFVPTEPARPSQFNFQAAHDFSALGVTVTREALQQVNPQQASSSYVDHDDCSQCMPCTIL